MEICPPVEKFLFDYASGKKTKTKPSSIYKYACVRACVRVSEREHVCINGYSTGNNNRPNHLLK